MRALVSFLILAGLILTFPAVAQIQTGTNRTDTIRIAKEDTTGKGSSKPVVVKDSARLAIERMPRQAAWRSAILPGLGQIHNKQWWKVPFVYGGFVAVGLAYDFNQRYYKEFLGEVQYRSAHDGQAKNPLYEGYSFEGMVRVKDAYRRNRDLSILGFAAWHAVNIIDAYIVAKFFRYDVGEDLSIHIEPSLQRTPAYSSRAYMIKINFAL